MNKIKVLKPLLFEGLEEGCVASGRICETYKFTEDVTTRHSKLAFTLAETMIVLIILGIVAAIAIPALVQRHAESTNRTKFKKAMNAYETAISKIVVENGIKSNNDLYGESGFAPSETCEKSINYFKTTETLTDGNCRFKSADGVFWDISNINKVIVARSAKDLNSATADSDVNRAFYLICEFDSSGSLRVNDLSYETSTDKEDLTRLYNYVNGKTVSVNTEIFASAEENAVQKTNPEILSDCKTQNAETCVIKYDCSTDDEPEKTCDLEMKKQIFTGNCATLSDINSCPAKEGVNYVAVDESLNGVSWNDAKCPSGTHLAYAGEIQQMWNNGAEGNVLESLCDSCSNASSPRFWAAETAANNSERAYTYAILRGNGMFLSGLKTNTNKVNHVVCVGD